jgi:hypothetical protein
MTSHRLGFAVKVLGAGGLPSHDTRRWQSGPHLRHSLERLRAILDYLDSNDVRMYRVATALAPYASHPELKQFHAQVEECAEELAVIGRLARERDIRLSSHPGQYTVLDSTDSAVQAAAVAELEVQAALFDAMGFGPEAVVVLHVGGIAGGTAAGCDRFLAGFEKLSEPARRRLVIENDDRSFGTGGRRGARGEGRPARRVGCAPSPLPRSARAQRPRGTRGRARDLAGRRDAEDPLLLAPSRHRGAEGAARPPRRDAGRAAAASRARRPRRSDRLRAVHPGGACRS